MRLFKQLPVLLGALALAGCAALSAVSTAAPIVESVVQAIQANGDKVVVNADKALILAHLGYQSVGEAALSGRRSGLIDTATWAKVKAYDSTVYGYLQKGDAAHDAATKANAAASALQAIDQLKALLPSSLFTK